MLVLSRQAGERVIIEVPPSDQPTTVEVVLVRLSYDHARLGFETPRAVNIRRSEVPNMLDDDVDTSFRASPLKQLGSAVQQARLGNGQ
jgi:carbon storage regulator CsrA